MVTVNESTYMLYAAAHYDNPHCYDIEEFNDDMNKFKYLLRLFSRYKNNNVLKERLILNHLITLYNVFPSEVATKLLFYKCSEYKSYLKTFLVFLNYMPERINGVETEDSIIFSSDIEIDNHIANILREI